MDYNIRRILLLLLSLSLSLFCFPFLLQRIMSFVEIISLRILADHLILEYTISVNILYLSLEIVYLVICNPA